MDKKPNWTFWNACELLHVWEAVGLSIDREPKSIRYVGDRQRSPALTNNRIRLYDAGDNTEFDLRLDLLQRAADLHRSQFVPVNDPYAGFKPFEQWRVYPDKVRLFFVEKGFPVPV